VGHGRIFDGSHLGIIEIEYVLKVEPSFDNVVSSFELRKS